jgi:hypothetical protein
MALLREYLLFSMPCKGIQRFYYAQKLVRRAFSRHGSHMRAAMLLLLAVTSWAREAFGVWKLHSARSAPAGIQRTMTLRIEPHTHGEVFTLDTVTPDGRALTSSTILYFDGKPRDFQDAACSGTQSSRRVDDRTVEILRECSGGGQIRLVRRAVRARILVLEIIEQNPDGRRSESRFVLEKR